MDAPIVCVDEPAFAYILPELIMAQLAVTGMHHSWFECSHIKGLLVFSKTHGRRVREISMGTASFSERGITIHNQGCSPTGWINR
jgi:hypothetical protein